jgi:ribose transport system permease protein
MKKNAGLFVLLLVACIVTYSLNERFAAPVNLENLLRRTALFSLMSIAVSLVVVAGGIDLSIGSVVCLTGTLLPWLTIGHGVPFALALCIVLAIATVCGFLHGTLITKLSLQPFIVTLCGLLLYRGFARGITGDQTQGFGLQLETIREVILHRVTLAGLLPVGIPAVVFVTAAIAGIAAVCMECTRLGLYLRAIGRNELATRYSGVHTERVTVIAYTLCALLAGLGGVLCILDVNSAQPADFGNFYELYAIAAAVLGGCSLRGGEWNIFGIIIGAMLMQVLRNAIVLLDIPTQLEFAIIGGVILIGVAGEQLARRLRTSGTRAVTSQS